MKISKADLLTPANFITTVGLTLTIVGIFSFNTLDGYLTVLIGKLLDIADGVVARRTHASQFGAAMDATADKVTGLIILIGAYSFRLAPTAVLLFFFLQHLFVSTISVVAAVRGKQLSVTTIGKRNMFLHLIVLFIFTSTQFYDGQLNDAVWVIASGLAVISVPLGIKTTAGYIKQFNKA